MGNKQDMEKLREIHDKYLQELKRLEASYSEWEEIENMQETRIGRYRAASNTRLCQGKISLLYKVINDIRHLQGEALIGEDSNRQGLIYNQE